MSSKNPSSPADEVQTVKPADQCNVRPRENKKLTKKRSSILGILQVLTAISSTSITLCRPTDELLETPGQYLAQNLTICEPNLTWSEQGFFKSGLYCGIPFALSAFLTFLAGVRPSRSKAAAVMISSGVSLLPAFHIFMLSMMWYYKALNARNILCGTGILQGLVSLTCIRLTNDEACCRCWNEHSCKCWRYTGDQCCT